MTKPRVKYKINRLAALVLAVVTIIGMLAICPQRAYALTEPEAIAGNAAILVDYDSGRTLYAQNADEIITPASTTKIMTALLVIEAIERGELTMDEQLTAKQSILDGVHYDGSRVKPYIVDGEIMTIRDYMYCMMLESDCVSCDILAERVSGSVDAFVSVMNARAAELGCQDTCFLNTHGYPVDGHYTTARSIMLITREALNHESFREMVDSIRYTVPKTNKNEQRLIYNSNWTIWNPEEIKSKYTKYYYPYAHGVKTGSSDKSGHCLSAYAVNGDVRLISVITGAVIANPSEGEWVNQSFTETARLFDWGFRNFRSRAAVSVGEEVASVPVTGSREEYVSAAASEAASLLIPSDSDVGDITTKIDLTSETVAAPVSSGDVLGSLKIYYKDELCSTIPLVAAKDIAVKVKEKPTGGTLALLIALMVLVVVTAITILYITNTRGILIDEVYPVKDLIEKVSEITGSNKQSAQTKKPQTKKQAGGSSANRPVKKQQPTGKGSGQHPNQAPRRRPEEAVPVRRRREKPFDFDQDS